MALHPLAVGYGPGDLYDPPAEPDEPDDAWEADGPGISPCALMFFAAGLLGVAEELTALTGRQAAVHQFTATNGRTRARSRRIHEKATDLQRRCEELRDFLQEFSENGPRYEATDDGAEEYQRYLARVDAEREAAQIDFDLTTGR